MSSTPMNYVSIFSVPLGGPGITLHSLSCTWLGVRDRWCSALVLCRALWPTGPPRLLPHDCVERLVNPAVIAELCVSRELRTQIGTFFRQLSHHRSQVAGEEHENDTFDASDELVEVPAPELVINPACRGAPEHSFLCRLSVYTRVTGYALKFDAAFHAAATAVSFSEMDEFFGLLARLPVKAVHVIPCDLEDEDGDFQLDENENDYSIHWYGRWLRARGERCLKQLEMLHVESGRSMSCWRVDMATFGLVEETYLRYMRVLHLDLRSSTWPEVGNIAHRSMDEVDDLFDCMPALQEVRLHGMHIGSVSFLHMLRQEWTVLDLEESLVTESVVVGLLGTALEKELFVNDATPPDVVVLYREHWTGFRDRHAMHATQLVHPTLNVSRGRELADMFLQLFPGENPFVFDELVERRYRGDLMDIEVNA